MSHSDVIIITVALFLTSTVGVYATIRCINQHINPPINSLSRRGDIELQYIEPSTNNTLDLLQPQQIYTSNINSGLEDSMNLQRTQSYWSGNPPSYNTLDLLQPQQVYTYERVPTYWSGSNINSCLEDSINLQSIPSFLNQSNINCSLEHSINLNYILFNLFFIVVLTIIFYLKNKTK